MVKCECCGALLKDGELICPECGTIAPRGTVPAEPEEPEERTVSAAAERYYERTVSTAAERKTEQIVSAAADVDPEQTVSAAPGWAKRPHPGPAAPAERQPLRTGNTPPAAPAYTPPTQPVYTAPVRERSKGGAIVMIVFGGFLLMSFFMLLYNLVSGVIYIGAGQEPYVLLPLLAVSAGLLSGGVLLLIFGIKKLRRVNDYNAKAGRNG